MMTREPEPGDDADDVTCTGLSMLAAEIAAFEDITGDTDLSPDGGAP